MKIKGTILIFLISCLVGISGEFTLGWIIYLTTGNFLWIYPGSSLRTTSLYTLPLWGIAGLIFYFAHCLVRRYIK